MQTARPGDSTTMRMVGGGAARCAAIGVGTRARGGGGVSEVTDYAAESRMGGTIFRVEIRGRDAVG